MVVVVVVEVVVEVVVVVVVAGSWWLRLMVWLIKCGPVSGDAASAEPQRYLFSQGAE